MALTFHPLSLALVAAAVLAGPCPAQAARRLSWDNADAGRATLATPPHGQLALNASLAGLEPGSTLRRVSHYVDGQGIARTRYQQVHRGVPVFGEHLLVAEHADGRLHSLAGTTVGGLDGDVANFEPIVKAAAAVSIAIDSTVGSGRDAMRIRDVKHQLMLRLNERDTATLVWAIRFFADLPTGGAPTRPTVLVDAITGHVVAQWDALTALRAGTGPGGNARSGRIEYGSGGTAFLDITRDASTCWLRSPHVVTYNFNHGTTADRPHAFSCPRNTVKEINGAYSPLNDAHFGASVVVEMFQRYLGKDPTAPPLEIGAHYGTGSRNAFWDGRRVNLGDGGPAMFPLTVLDIVAHETAHGFTEQNAGLMNIEQSGGINEAFSDMVGEAAEVYLRGRNDFIVGAELFKKSGAVRYMDVPSRDGLSIDHADRFEPGMNPHFSSGVYNRAFYLLSRTSGWDVITAFRVFAKANSDYWTPSTDFNRGACGVRRAAADLGLNSGDVDAAFSAVGVRCVS